MKFNKKLMAMMLVGAMASMTMVGCSKEAPTNQVESNEGVQSQLSSEEIYNQLIEGIELGKLAPITPELFADSYGIDESMLVDYKVMVPVISAVITEIGVFQATEGNVDAVEAAVKQRLEKLQNGGAFYPEHVEIANKGQVIKKGNYVIFIADQYVDEMVEKLDTILK